MHNHLIMHMVIVHELITPIIETETDQNGHTIINSTLISSTLNFTRIVLCINATEALNVVYSISQSTPNIGYYFLSLFFLTSMFECTPNLFAAIFHKH